MIQQKLKLALLALCYASLTFAQNDKTKTNKNPMMDESAFTFTEAQLGEDENMTQNVIILNSSTNAYASGVGYRFSPVRFRYRALSQEYNDVYINGVPMNDMESGQFRYSMIGGLNQQTRNVDFALPFESNSFAMNGLAGSNNYDFRAGSMAAGNRISLGAANRNYSARGMYTYASGFNANGWAIAANLTYRWADKGYVEGTFYNSLSYFLAIQKRWTNGHSLSLSTWGNPTERASQGASTDEAYWLANNYLYNPYWGYQNGKIRNSRVVNDFAPSALLTWDWDIAKDTKLTTSLFGKYSKYKSTKLNYNNAENPQPDYWKNLPSMYYDVWGDEANSNAKSHAAFLEWNEAYNYWTAAKENRQVKWDQLYWANQQAAKTGSDALYYVQAKHNDNFVMNLASTLTTKLSKNQTWNIGAVLGRNQGGHYQTMEDLLGANSFHNINTYAVGNYPKSSDAVQYDLNTMGADRTGRLVSKGDKFGYDYDILIHKALVWTNYLANMGRFHLMVAGKVGGTDMQRQGYMRNGMFPENSYGKSGHAKFLDGGGKASITWDAGLGNIVSVGAGYEWRAPTARTAFASPEMNNDFVLNLKNQQVFSSELGYQYQNAWVHANINAYYNRMNHVTEWQNFYFDNLNSFSYVSMTGIEKEAYGVELGARFKLASFLDLTTLGTWSEAKNINNAKVRYLNSTKAQYVDETVYNKGMREGGTPLTAASLGLSFHQGGWFVDLNGNYYDRIYLFYTPCYRYESTLHLKNSNDNEENNIIPEQAKGKGGFMLDGSIGKSIRLKKGQLNLNLMVTNILNNRRIATGGYEQSRSSFYTTENGNDVTRTYKFPHNPKKYYAYGINGMFQVSYRF